MWALDRVMERQVGAWQWKCAATSLPLPFIVPAVVCMGGGQDCACGESRSVVLVLVSLGHVKSVNPLKKADT